MNPPISPTVYTPHGYRSNGAGAMKKPRSCDRGCEFRFRSTAYFRDARYFAGSCWNVGMQSSQQKPILLPACATVTFGSLLCSDMTAQYWLDTASDALACVAGPVVGVMSTSTSPVVGVEPPGVEGVVSTRASQPIIVLETSITAKPLPIHSSEERRVGEDGQH